MENDVYLATNMSTYTNSNVSLEEWIRLNNVTDSIIIEAADMLLEQEQELKEAYDRIEDLKSIIHGFDVESIEYELDALSKIVDGKAIDKLIAIQTLLDNFKQRRG